MDSGILEIVTLSATVTTGMIGGLFFAFSTFVMQSLGRMPGTQGMVAMQTINRLILNPLFALLFFGSALSCGWLVGARLMGAESVGGLAVVGALVYLIGSFAYTFVVHIPMNNALEARDPEAPDSPAAWQRYRVRWTALNHVRTLASVAACVMLIVGE